MSKETAIAKLACHVSKNPAKALDALTTVATTVAETAVVTAPIVLPAAAIAAAGYGIYRLVKRIF